MFETRLALSLNEAVAWERYAWAEIRRIVVALVSAVLIRLAASRIDALDTSSARIIKSLKDLGLELQSRKAHP